MIASNMAICHFKKKRIFKFIYLMVFCLTVHTYGQTSEVKEPKTFWQKIAGEPLKTSITFLPVGSHTKNVDVFGVWYTSYNYKSIEFGAFSNSYGELTFGLFYKREINFTDKFSLIYGGGLLYGYHGKLQDVKGVPFKKSFLFNGEINPILGLELDYKISKKISFHTNIAPLILIYGVKYYL